MAFRPIVLFGCLHEGMRDQDKEMALKYRDAILKRRDAMAILLGDNFECSIPGHRPETMWDQVRTPMEQYEEVVEYFKPIRKRVVGACSSNHSARVRRATSLDMDYMLADRLGWDRSYVGTGGIIRVPVGKVEYTFAISHGKSSGVDPWRDAKKLLAIYPRVDAVLLSHTHRSVWEWNGYMNLKGEIEKVAFVRTGSLLDYAKYAKEAMYTPNIKGFTVLWVCDKKKILRPDTTGEVPPF